MVFLEGLHFLTTTRVASARSNINQIYFSTFHCYPVHLFLFLLLLLFFFYFYFCSCLFRNEPTQRKEEKDEKKNQQSKNFVEKSTTRKQCKHLWLNCYIFFLFSFRHEFSLKQMSYFQIQSNRSKSEWEE